MMRRALAVIHGHSFGVAVRYKSSRLLIDDVTFSHCRGFYLHPFGKAHAVSTKWRP